MNLRDTLENWSEFAVAGAHVGEKQEESMVRQRERSQKVCFVILDNLILITQ